MVDLRREMERDLGESLEGDFALPIEMIAPDGSVQTESLNGGVLRGMIVYESAQFSPKTGSLVYGERVIVSLRRTSLVRIPEVRENWVVRIPVDPSWDSEMVSYQVAEIHRTGRSVGFINLELARLRDK